MPTPIDEHYIDTAWGAKLRCLSAGDGPKTIVLIPGITMTADVFTHQMERFASSTVRVVSYDPRGQGDSTKGWDHHDYDTRAEDVNNVMQAFADGPVVLGSWSQGLFEHLAFVRRHGVDRTAASIIIDSAPRQMCEDPTKEWGWCQAGWLNPSSPADAHIETWILGPTVDRAGFNNDLITWILEDPNPTSRAYFEKMCAKTPDGIASLLSAMVIPLDFQDELKALARHQPTQIIVREDWKGVAGQWVSKHAPRATFNTMPRHASFWERPELLNEPVARFLNDTLHWGV